MADRTDRERFIGIYRDKIKREGSEELDRKSVV